MKSNWLVSIAICALVLLVRFVVDRQLLARAKSRVQRWAQLNGITIDEQATEFKFSGGLFAEMEVQGADKQGVVRRYTLRLSPKLAFYSLLDIPVVVKSRAVASPSRRQ